jgi:PEP-CTERM motif
MKMTLKVALLAMIIMAVEKLAAQTTIISETFEGSLSSGAAFAQYYGGDCTSYANGIVAGVGTSGSGGWQIVLNAASGGSAGYSYMGAQYQNGGITGNTSANLSDYTLSFDAMATAGSLNLQLQSWSGAGFGGTQSGTLNTAPANPGYGNDLTLNPAYTHYSLNLGDTGVFQDNTGFLPNGGTIQIAFQLNGGGTTPYSDTLDVDNLTLTMVPEPTSMALLGIGALIGTFSVCRRKLF